MFLITVKDSQAVKATVGLPSEVIDEIGKDLILRVIGKLARAEEFKDLDAEAMQGIYSILENSLSDLMTDDLEGWDGFERGIMQYTK